MNKKIIIAIMACLSGCAIAPTSIVTTPKTARPVSNLSSQATPGAIYNAATYKALFEDRRAKFVGDLVTINIAENTLATKDGSSGGSKSGAIKSSVTSYMGSPLPNADFNAASSLSYKDGAKESASNVFTGSITATVTEVLPNGNLMLGGEKQIAFDKGTEYVRFSGVVSPDVLTAGNVVSSSKVADARIEYRTGSKIDAAQVLGMLARFFLSVSPF